MSEIAAPSTGTTLPVAEPAVSRMYRLHALTGVRILAAGAVYLSHMRPPKGAPSIVVAFMASGYMGVTLFFTLSGFVLSLNYFDRLQCPRPRVLWNYAIARFARIYPLYIVILLYFFVNYQAHSVALTDWPEHVLALQAWDSSAVVTDKFNGPAWSISVEFFLYACLPFLVFALSRVRSPRGLLLVGLGVVTVLAVVTAIFMLTGHGDLNVADPRGAHRWLYRTPLTRLCDFTLGVLAARLYLMTRGRPVVAAAGTPLVLVGAVTLVALMAWPAHVASAPSWDISYLVPSVAIIFGLAIAPDGVPSRLLALPFMVLLGEASYAFYLCHLQIMGVLGAGQWADHVTLSAILLELFFLGIVTCTAAGLHVLVEKPAREWIRRVATAGRTPEGNAVAPTTESQPA